MTDKGIHISISGGNIQGVAVAGKVSVTNSTQMILESSNTSRKIQDLIERLGNSEIDQETRSAIQSALGKFQKIDPQLATNPEELRMQHSDTLSATERNALHWLGKSSEAVALNITSSWVWVNIVMPMLAALS